MSPTATEAEVPTPVTLEPAGAPPAPAPPARSRARWAVYVNIAALTLGVALLVSLVLKLDLVQLGAKLRLVGWAFLGAVAAFVGGLVVSSAAWQCMVDPARSRARFRDFLVAFWVGYSINALTPTAQLGNVVRGTILSAKVETKEVIASLVTFTFFAYASNLALMLFAPLLCLLVLDLPTRAVLLVLGVAVAFFVPMTLVYVFLRRGAAATVIRLVAKLPLVRFKDPAAMAEKAGAIDERIRTFRAQRPRLFWGAVFWITWARLLQAIEYWFLLAVLMHDRTILALGALALLTQASSQAVTWVATFVPSQVGVAEANTTLLYKLLALDPVVGLTLEIVRRIRAILGIAIGLLLGWGSGLWRRRPSSPPPSAGA